MNFLPINMQRSNIKTAVKPPYSGWVSEYARFMEHYPDVVDWIDSLPDEIFPLNGKVASIKYDYISLLVAERTMPDVHHKDRKRFKIRYETTSQGSCMILIDGWCTWWIETLFQDDWCQFSTKAHAAAVGDLDVWLGDSPNFKSLRHDKVSVQAKAPEGNMYNTALDYVVGNSLCQIEAYKIVPDIWTIPLEPAISYTLKPNTVPWYKFPPRNSLYTTAGNATDIFEQASFDFKCLFGTKAFLPSIGKFIEFYWYFLNEWRGPYYSRFKGIFEDCVFNASQVNCTKAIKCNFWDINKAADPYYKINFQTAEESTFATNWASIFGTGQFINSCIRQDQIDVSYTDTKVEACWLEDIDGYVSGELIRVKAIKLKVAGELILKGANIEDGELTGSKFDIRGLYLRNSSIHTSGDMLLDDSRLIDSVVNASTGAYAIKGLGMDNSTLSLQTGAILENSSVVGGSTLLLGQNVVFKSSAVANGGTLTIGEGTQLEGCFLSVAQNTTVVDNITLIGVDLGLKTHWGYADDMGGEITHMGLSRQTQATYGIPVTSINLNQCIIKHSDYWALTSGARSEFELFKDYVLAYDKLLYPSSGGTSNEAEKLWVAKDQISDSTLQELKTLEVNILGCEKHKWWYPISYPYDLNTIVDPRRP